MTKSIVWRNEGVNGRAEVAEVVPVRTTRHAYFAQFGSGCIPADMRNVEVTATLDDMAEPRTGAERYFAKRLEDAEYRQAYTEARGRIEQIDSVIRAFDSRREELHLSKAELARRAGVKPEAIRRLLSAERPNPTLSTLVALASALDLEIMPKPRRGSSTSRVRSAASGTQRRSA